MRRGRVFREILYYVGHASASSRTDGQRGCTYILKICLCIHIHIMCTHAYKYMSIPRTHTHTEYGPSKLQWFVGASGHCVCEDFIEWENYTSVIVIIMTFRYDRVPVGRIGRTLIIWLYVRAFVRGSVSMRECNAVAMMVTALASRLRPATTILVSPLCIPMLPPRSNYTIIYDLLHASLQVGRLSDKRNRHHTSYVSSWSHYTIIIWTL